MATVGEVSNRVSKMEGAYEHLAAKADIANLKADIANLKVWLLGSIFAGMIAAVSIALGVARLLEV